MNLIVRCLVLFLLTVTSARAGASFAPSWATNGTTLARHNTALLRVGLVFRVYEAGLYLANADDATRILEDVPKRLELVYLRDLKAAVLIDAARDYLARNHTPEEIASIQARLDRINQLYSDVKEGDRYSLTYLPGVGSELALNGRPLGTIPGADFARIYFGIWLGPGCAKPDFRDALLKSPPDAR